MIEAHTRYQRPRPPFGTWLLKQVHRDDPIGNLAKAAAADRSFPRSGDVKAISKRLNIAGADPEMHQALEEAELDWICI